ncbi:MAG: fibronectin type III domain-containing protein [Prevotellaceae bacterium]|nr:fibronectin type III domain-containing protein [Prevotellaceae bacterium]
MRKPLYILFFGIVLLLYSCEKDAEPTNFAPKLTTYESVPENIQRTEATLRGKIIHDRNSYIDECGIMYSEQEDFAIPKTSTIDVSTEGDFSVTLTGLVPGTDYYYCTYAKSGHSTIKGKVERFMTPQVVVPVFGELIVSNITQTGFDIAANIEDAGGSTIQECGFMYIATEEDIELSALMNLKYPVKASADGSYRLSVNRLNPNTRYAICAYAMTLEGDNGYSRISYVNTLDAELPIVSGVIMNDKDGIKQLHLSASILTSNIEDVKECGFVYSTNNQFPALNEDLTSKLRAETTNTNFQAVLPELLPDNTYYIRAYATNSFGTGYGDVLTYITDKYSFPVVTTSGATEIGEDGATLHGVLEDDGNSPILLRGFVWSHTNQNPTIEDNRIDSPTSKKEFSAKITEGLSSQTYYYRAYAVNGKGPGYGSVMSFTTIKAIPPTVSATTVSDITTTTATVSSAVSDNGSAAVTEKGFVLSSTVTVPTVSDTKVVSTSAGNAIVSKLSGLADNTRYYIRAFATNKNGTSYGAVQVFNTLDKNEFTSIEKEDFGEDEVW